MSEAAKLFNQSGGAANGGKQDVVNGAAQVRVEFFEVDPEAGGLTRSASSCLGLRYTQMMMKLLIQSKMSGMFGTGGGAAGTGGGMGGLMCESGFSSFRHPST